MDLIREIKYQRDLASAVNNELTPVFSTTSSLEILYSTYQLQQKDLTGD